MHNLATQLVTLHQKLKAIQENLERSGLRNVDIDQAIKLVEESQSHLRNRKRIVKVVAFLRDAWKLIDEIQKFF